MSSSSDAYLILGCYPEEAELLPETLKRAEEYCNEWEDCSYSYKELSTFISEELWGEDLLSPIIVESLSGEDRPVGVGLYSVCRGSQKFSLLGLEEKIKEAKVKWFKHFKNEPQLIICSNYS